jgi:hypothetical protein
MVKDWCLVPIGKSRLYGGRNLGACDKCGLTIREPAKVVPGLGVVHPGCAPEGFVQLAMGIRAVRQYLQPKRFPTYKGE